MPSSPSDLLNELDAVIAGIPEQDLKHDAPEVGVTILAWVKTLVPERAAALRTGLRGWLASGHPWQINMAVEIAEMWRDEELMNAAVCEARRRFEVEASDKEEPRVMLNGRLSGALATFPVASGVAYLRELAARLGVSTRDDERLICARAAIALCYIEQSPLSCLEPILATLRAWEDRRLAVVPVGLMWSLYGHRRKEQRALTALLRADEITHLGV